MLIQHHFNRDFANPLGYILPANVFLLCLPERDFITLSISFTLISSQYSGELAEVVIGNITQSMYIQ